MKLRKPLAILLVLVLSLGIAPITGASGAIEGQSTTFQSKGTITPEMMRASSSEPSGNIMQTDKEIATIKVKVTNIYAIQVNPYGMTVNIPGTSRISNNSIVTAPIIIENSSGVQMDVTATATVTAEGDVAFESEPPEPYIPSQFDDPDNIPSEERVFLFMLMTTKVEDKTPNWSTVWSMGSDGNGNPVWPTDEAYSEEKKKFTSNVITRDGGSGQITMTMDKGDETAPGLAALQIFGQTNKPSIPSPPSFAPWHRGNGFNVTIVLSFIPRQAEGYTVTFDVMDVLWEDGQALRTPVYIYLQDHADPNMKNPLEFPAGYLTANSPESTIETLTFGPVDVASEKSLTFTVKTAEEEKGECYIIRNVKCFYSDEEDDWEFLYRWKSGENAYVKRTCTVDATRIKPNDKLKIEITLFYTTFN